MAEQRIQKIFDLEQLERLLEKLSGKYGSPELDITKNQLSFSNNSSILLRLPYSFSYLNNALSPSNFLIIIIHAGEAALGYSEEDQLIEHKMIKAYMVRQKQGKSQLKHLKTKGKSKAGSRVRLAGTEHFFEEINKKIAEWNQYFQINKITISCNKTLQPYFFNRADAALNKDDVRLLKIPKHIQEAKLENLISIHNYLISTELKFDNADKDIITNITDFIEHE
jgi:hypothetical protein